MGRLRKNAKHEMQLQNDKVFFVENPVSFKGNWNEKVFQNKNPIFIEIGCGKGKFIFENAIKNPNINFIAIDKFATVLYKVLKKTKDFETLKNLKIICYDALLLNNVFSENEISKIYLNFSDPWPKKSHEKNRLTNIKFLNVYFNFLKKDGFIEFKTDNNSLYEYSLSVIKDNNLNLIYNNNDIYNDLENNEDNIQTEYEIKWLEKGVTIKKIIFNNVK